MLQNFLRRCGAILPAVTAAVLMLSSCSHKTMLPYFRDVTESEVQLTVPKQVEIEPDDELYIMVSSPQPTATAQFNFPTINPASGESTLVNAGSKQLTYFVDAEGNIDIPALGKVHVAGLTVEQIQTKIKDLISKWVDNPSVEVRLMSFRVNMLGEFTKPGTVVTDRKTPQNRTILTKYRVLEQRGGNSLLEVDLLTGRTHQIRAQFSNIGHPLVGDGKYGSRINGDVALCSFRLSFIHPLTKEKLCFSILPEMKQKWKLFEKELAFFGIES